MLTGGRVYGATLEPDADSFAHVRFSRAGGGDRAAVAFMLAGFEAERRAGFDVEPGGPDLEAAQQVALSEAGGDHEAASAVLAEETSRLRALMGSPEVWRSIERVAGRLEQKSAVTGRGLKRILREAGALR